MIELDEKDYIVCFWLAVDIDDNEFMMLLRRRDDNWLVDGRFRYKNDDRVWDSQDKKHFYHAESPPGTSEEEALNGCHELFELTGTQYCLRRIWQRIDGGVDKFIEAVKKYDRFHMKEIGNEQPESTMP